MAQVNVTINGKNYRMACDEGQEDHLRMLGEKLDSYVGKLKGSFGEIGDQRLTVMAGVMVTDELCEMQEKVASLEAEVETLKKNSNMVVGEMSSAEEQAAKQISDIAEKLNSIVGKINSRTTDN